MDLENLNEKIERSNYYKFTQRHKKVILIIQGLFIIGLLISLNIYVYKDHFIKKQIAERCGYVDSKYKCICEAHYVDNWENMQKDIFEVNFSNVENVPT